MADLRDVMAYLCEHYPHKEELSKARLTKMVYLADWKSAIDQDRPMTEITWVFNHYGPYVDDVVQEAEEDPAFVVKGTQNIYGDPKSIIECEGSREYPSLSNEDKRILDSIIESSKKKTWNEFIRLVYSTYPVMTQDRFSEFDLVDLARRYANDQAALHS